MKVSPSKPLRMKIFGLLKLFILLSLAGTIAAAQDVRLRARVDLVVVAAHGERQQLGLELAEFKIRINAIAPGPFVTNIGGGWLKKDPVARAAWDAIVPLGSVAETDQLKPLALLLASDASDYMTGSHVVIDGGMMLGKYK